MTPTGFIGLGLMGAPMAANLVRAGFPVTVWNRSPAKSAALAALGAQVTASAGEVGAVSDVLITMVSDDAALEEILLGPQGCVHALRPGSVVVDMSTTSPACMERLAERLADHDLRLVDAPVFGSTDRAVSGDLWAVVGADPVDLDRVRPQLEAMCATIFPMGPVGSGSAMKVAGNLVVTGMIALLGESLTLGGHHGLRPEAMIDVLEAIDFTSPVWRGKGSLVVDGDYAPRFPLRHALKDVRLAQAVAAAHGIRLPVVDGAEAAYERASTAGLGDQDVIAVIQTMQNPSHEQGRTS